MSVKSRKYIRNDAPLPGFPWNGTFHDIAEIREYFSHDKLQCLLCGRDFAGLGTHITRAHEIPPDDYKGQFGLPWTSGFSGKELKERQSRHARKIWRAGKLKPQTILSSTRKRKNRKALVAFRNAFVERNVKRFELKRKRDAKVYEEFLRRIKTGRTPAEVSKDKDMPSAKLFRKYMLRNPAFRQRFEVIWDRLPFIVQSRGGHFGERVKNRVVKLRLKGHTFPEIGDMLGLPGASVCNIWFDCKHSSTGAKRKEMEDYEKSLEWGPKIYDEFLRRIATGRTAGEVSKDKDMPSLHSFGYHLRENPAFRKIFEDIWDKLPFAVQVRGRRLGKSFIKAFIDSRISGLSWRQMSRKLGIGAKTLQGIWLRLKKTGTRAEKKIITDYSKKLHEATHWSEATMEEFLRRLRSGRTVREVGQDKDMPGALFFYSYVRKHADYKEKYQKIRERLSIADRLRSIKSGNRVRNKTALPQRSGVQKKRAIA